MAADATTTLPELGTHRPADDHLATAGSGVPPRDLPWESYLAAELEAEEDTVRRFLTVPQALELARLHIVEGLSVDEIAARWPTWDAEQVRRALRAERFRRAAERVQSESRSLAGRLIARLNIGAEKTIDRIMRIAHGEEGAGTAVDREGNQVPVPFSDKVQWEAARWHAERVLPPVATPGSGQPGATINIYNPTTYNATMAQLNSGMAKLTTLFGGDPSRLPSEAGLGGVLDSDGNVIAGAPPSMSLYLKQGAEQLVTKDDVPPAIVISSEDVP